MNQLGLLRGSNIFGDEPKPQDDPYRTADGALKVKAKKAIDWYMKEHDLSLMATGVYPWISFRVSDGNEQPVHIQEIVADYEVQRIRSGRVAS